jgi:uncharacterized membrane protein
MAFCPNCGANVSDDATFCASCGQPIGGAGQQQQQYQQYQAYRPKPTAYVPETDEQDIRDNSTLSLFCYLGIFVILPLTAKPESKYVKFHANQGICLMLYYIIIMLCAIVPFLGWIVAAVGYIFGFVCLIMGVVRACNGRMIPLPLIGKYNILNYK